MVKKEVQIFLVYFLVVLYALCYQLQSPIEPFLVDKLVGKGGDSATQYAKLQSFFSVVQTIGSLIFGYVLDVFGLRVGFAINFLGCALQYYMLATTTSIEMLFASKIPGVFMAGFLCAQTAVSVLTAPGTERVTVLGRLTTAYTVGGVIGPYLGGWLGATGDYFVSARYACGGSLLAAVLVLFLPSEAERKEAAAQEASKKDGKDDEMGDGGESKRSWFERVLLILRLVGVLFFVKIASGVANSMSRSAQPLILKNELKFTEADMGKFLSASFAFGGFANGFLLGPLTAFLGGDVQVMVTNCLRLMGTFYAGQAMLYSAASPLMAVAGAARQYPFIIMSMGLSMFQYSLGTGITAETTQTVPEDMKGTLMGMEHALFSLARIGGPAAGVMLLENHGITGLSAVVAAVFAALFVVMRVFAPASKTSKGQKAE
jgi:OCT family organic cation transporter-like MFS transporter 18